MQQAEDRMGQKEQLQVKTDFCPFHSTSLLASTEARSLWQSYQKLQLLRKRNGCIKSKVPKPFLHTYALLHKGFYLRIKVSFVEASEVRIMAVQREKSSAKSCV